MKRVWLSGLIGGVLALGAYCAPGVAWGDDEEVEDLLSDRPQYVTPRAEAAIERAVQYLARSQRRDGSLREGQTSYGSYPTAMSGLAGMAFLAHGDTPMRGEYAPNVERLVRYLVSMSNRQTGLITASGSGEESRSMYGHGFSTMFLACALGEIGDPELQSEVQEVLDRGVDLIARSQSGAGGWLYTPDSNGDEGSVTVTQVQALRACRNSGLAVPVQVVNRAVGYIEASLQPDGGISYQAGGTGSQPALTAAAVAVLYNAGQYDSPVAERCLAFCRQRINVAGQGGGLWGHWYYTHMYLSQAYWQVGGEDWSRYYPQIRDALLATQNADGSWQGDGVGLVYGTSIATMILSLPYERVPLYMR